MSVYVFLSYKDEDDGYHGFLGSLEAEEYTILNRLSERCTSPGILSTDELMTLSDIKDLLAKTQIKLYEVEKELTEEASQKLEKVRNSLGMTLESFDAYREEAPQLDLLLSFCIIDAGYSEIGETGEYESKNFIVLNPEEGVIPGLDELIQSGDITHIAVSYELMSFIDEWIDLDGRRILSEAQIAEDEVGWEIKRDSIGTEFEWWRHNIAYDDCEYDFTAMLFRAIRNNVLKSKRTGDAVLSSEEWSKRIEVL